MTNLSIAGLGTGRTYNIQVRSIGVNGERSEWSEAVPYTVPADTTPPLDATGLTVDFNESTFIAKWDDTQPKLSSDFKDFEVVVSPNADFSAGKTYYTRATTVEIPFEVNRKEFTTARATLYVRVKVRDTSNNASAGIVGSGTNPAPLTPTGTLVANGISQAYVIDSSAFNNKPNDYLSTVITRYDAASGGVGTVLGEGTDTTLTIRTTDYTTRYLVAQYKDIFGQTSAETSPRVAVTALNPVLTDTTAPTTPTGISGAWTGTVFGVTFNKSPEADTARYIINLTASSVTKSFSVGSTGTATQTFSLALQDNSAAWGTAQSAISGTVQAVDTYGNTSSASSSTGVITYSTAAPTVSGASVTAGNYSYTAAWANVTSDDYAYTEVAAAASSGGSLTTVWQGKGSSANVSATAGVAKYVKIRHVNVFGTAGTYSSEFAVTPTDPVLAALDSTPPGSVTSLTRTFSTSTFVLNFTSPATADLQDFVISLTDGSTAKLFTQDAIGVGSATAQVFNLTAAQNAALWGTAKPTLSGTIKTRDKLGNIESTGVTITSITATDNTAVPSGEVVNAIPKAYTVSWTTPAWDGYSYSEIYDSSTLGGTYAVVWKGTDSTATINRSDYTQRFVKVRHYDVFGRYKEDAAGTAVTPINPLAVDTTPPAIPTTGFSSSIVTNPATTNDETGQAALITMNWTGVADTDLTGYKVKIVAGAASVSSDSGITLDVTSTPGATAKSVVFRGQCNQAYNWWVASYDQLNNVSNWSATQAISATTDTTAPATPTGLALTKAENNVIATWTGSATAVDFNPAVGIGYYKVEFASGSGYTTDYQSQNAQSTNMSFVAPIYNATYYVKVSAVDSNGNVSTATADQTIAIGPDISKLSGTTLNSDPLLMDPNAWTVWSGVAPTFTTVTDGATGKNVMRGPTSTGHTITKALIPIDTNKTYTMRVLVRKSATANGTFYAGLFMKNGADVWINSGTSQSGYKVAAGVAISANWTEYSAQYSPSDFPNVSTTATYASGGAGGATTVLISAPNTNIRVGQALTGTGFAANTLVTSNSGTTISFTPAASSQISGTLTFTAQTGLQAAPLVILNYGGTLGYHEVNYVGVEEAMSGDRFAPDTYLVNKAFRVGDTAANQINIIAGSTGIAGKVYSGSSGVYNNTNTGFYLDGGGNFSLKDKLSFDGSTLTVAGVVNATSGNLTGGLTVGTNGTIAGGQSAYNTGTGFFLGHSSALYKLSIGNPSGQSLTWDGNNLNITGNLTLTSASNIRGQSLIPIDFTGFSNINTTGGAEAGSIVSGMGPLKSTDTIWRVLSNDVGSDADGGWVSTSASISGSREYRVSTFIRQFTTGVGSKYFGILAQYPQIASNDRQMTAYDINYYSLAADYPQMEINKWYCLVEHVHSAPMNLFGGLSSVTGDDLTTWQSLGTVTKTAGVSYKSATWTRVNASASGGIRGSVDLTYLNYNMTTASTQNAGSTTLTCAVYIHAADFAVYGTGIPAGTTIVGAPTGAGPFTYTLSQALNGTSSSGSTVKLQWRYHVASVDIANDQATPQTVQIDWCDIAGSGDLTLAAGETKRISTPVSTPPTAAGYDSTYRFFDLSASGTANFLVRRPMVERVEAAGTHNGVWVDTDVSRSGRSGIYDMEGNLILETKDARFTRSSDTLLNVRSFQFYDATGLAGAEWARPRIDLVDGTEPSIEELIGIPQGTPTSLSSQVTGVDITNTGSIYTTVSGVAKTYGVYTQPGWLLSYNQGSPLFDIGNSTGYMRFDNVSGLIIKGDITADTGHIGGTSGWTISTNKISSGTGITEVGIANTGTSTFWAGGSTGAAPFRVTSGGVLTAQSGTVGGVNMSPTALYIGTGTFNNTNTGFYVDSSGNFSLKDQLSWDGTTLNVKGAVAMMNGDVRGNLGIGGSLVAGTRFAVTNKALTTNVATITATGHTFAINDVVTVSIGDPVFDGTFTVTGIATNTFTYAKTNANVTSVATTGYATRSNKSAVILNSTGISALDNAGASRFSVTTAGVLTADSGTVGGWTLGATTLTGTNMQLTNTGVLFAGSADNSVTISAADATYRIWAGNATAASAAFRVTQTGILTATGATITGALTATSGTFTGTVSALAGTIAGNLGIGGTIVANLTYTVTTKAITGGNTATLTTSATHGLVSGDTINVAIGDPTFDGQFTAGAGTTGTSVVYPKTATNTGPTAVTPNGYVTRGNKQRVLLTSTGIEGRDASNNIVFSLPSGGSTVATIGGWSFDNTRMYSGPSSGNYVGVSNSTNAFYAGGTNADGSGTNKFQVTQAGALTITAGSASNFNGILPAPNTGDIAFFAGATSTAGAAALFKVTAGGALTATSATITGAITATSGSISGTVTIGATTASTIESNASTGASKPNVFYQGTAPSTGSAAGSIWYDTANSNKMYTLVSSVWTVVGNTATFAQTTAPATTVAAGSIWYDTDDNNKTYVLIAGVWTAVETNSAGVGLGNVSNVGPQLQAQNGLQSGVSITGGGITMATAASIKAGKANYADATTAGFFLGYDTGVKFRIGNSATSELTFDGSNLSVTGALNATSGNFTGSVSLGSGGALYGNKSTYASATAGFWLGNDAGTYKFKIGTNTDYMQWDGTNLALAGTSTNSSLSIGTGSSIFKVDSSGMYLGNAAFGSANFSVTYAGLLTAKSGTVGGWTLGASQMYAGSGAGSFTSLTATAAGTVFFAGADNTSGTNAKTSITAAGALTSTSANITGAITATSGAIGNWTISGNNIVGPAGAGAEIQTNSTGNGMAMSSGIFGGVAGIYGYDTTAGFPYAAPYWTYSIEQNNAATTIDGRTVQVNSDTAATYTWAANVLTIVTTAFGATAGERVMIDFTSGSLSGKASYTVASGGNTFTITKTGSGTGGNCTIKKFQVHTSIFNGANLGQGLASAFADAPGITLMSSVYASRVRQSSLDITADNILICSDDTALKGWIKIGPFTNPTFINYDGSYKVGNGTYRPIAASAFNINSDVRLKKNITSIETAWDKLMSIRPVQYNWIGGDGHEDDGVDREGFIAQELEVFYPEVVTTPLLGPDDTIAYKQVDLSKLIPSITRALQEAMLRIESLEEEIRQLKG